jgi:hypothetical protein
MNYFESLTKDDWSTIIHEKMCFDEIVQLLVNRNRADKKPDNIKQGDKK